MARTSDDETRLRLMRAAAALRVGLMAWGAVQDARFDVAYTDVDYLVFTDAARFMSRGESPYERNTYRYSPLIAAALLPNVWLHPLWGKCVFAAGDVLAGWLIQRVLRRQGVEERTALACTAAWLFNPFTMTVRGNRVGRSVGRSSAPSIHNAHAHAHAHTHRPPFKILSLTSHLMHLSELSHPLSPSFLKPLVRRVS